MNVLVTGATGFVGHELVETLLAQGHQVSALVRQFTPSLADSVRQIEMGDLALMPKSDSQDVDDRDVKFNRIDDQLPNQNKLTTALEAVDTVVHLAARVHIMNDKAEEPLTELRKVNTDVTLDLARQAAKAGVKRFIFLSTIKVNGESTTGRLPFSEEDYCYPTDPYAISKMEAEQGLMEIAKETGIEVVIIRPPLIYGAGVKGNFASIMRWVGKGIPLPLGAVRNQRSLLALNNLVSFIIHCLDHPKAASEVFLLSDGEDVSTAELIRKLATAQEKKARLLPVPVSWMKFAARLLGKQDVAERLFGSLQIDSSKAREQLGWRPIVSVDEQLRQIAEEETPRRCSG